MNHAPARGRNIVLLFACLLAMITYLDRACFGAVAPTLVKELGLTSLGDLKWAMTAFAIAYAIFEIPAGWLGDVWGPRAALLRIVAWWSLFTALTAIVGLKFGTVTLGVGTLVVLRFLFGAGEAGAYPNITRALHNWFPPERAATAQGWVWMSSRLMGGLTPLVWVFLVVGTEKSAPLFSWRGAFVLFGLVGVAWCAAFAFFFRDHPDRTMTGGPVSRVDVDPSETAESSHTALPLGAFVRSGNLWLLCLMYFCMVYGWAFHVTYLPGYMLDRFRLDPKSTIAALYMGGPLWVGAFGCLAGGALVDWLIRHWGDRRRVRRLVGVTAESLCALGWIGAIFAPNAMLFFLSVSLAALCNDMTLASAWATCQDIGGRYTAMTAATMNTIGTLGAAVAGWLTGTIVDVVIRQQADSLNVAVDQLPPTEKLAATMTGFDYCFVTFFTAYVVAAICWRFIDATKPIVDSVSESA